MFILIFCIALVLAPLCLIVQAVSRRGKAAPPTEPAPRRKDPIDEHMDENYADIDWLRRGKL